MNEIQILLENKGYVRKISEELRDKKGIQLYALKRGNSKNPLPKPFQNIISKLRR